jgi:GTP-binding protein EngB required for normal cell division
MEPQDVDEKALIEWYRTKAKPLLQEFAPTRVPAIDNDRDRLERLLAERDGITACFIGNSGIGKSTLINALTSGTHHVVPAGGIGPLTARATEIRYSPVPMFSVRYHKKGLLWRIGFALEQHLQRNKADDGATRDPDAFGSGLDDAERLRIAQETEPEDAESSFDAYLKQAQQIIAGDQFAQRPIEYVVDGLRLACDLRPRWNASISADDLQRVERVKDVLKKSAVDEEVRHMQRGEQEFASILHDHAAGFLSPLIQHIEVGWPSMLLQQGVTMVDLPGVGIAHDSYRQVTKAYVREKARVVVLVVDRAGPTEASIELLRTSGYWDRLVGAADDPSSDPCHLLIAVTRVDDVATEDWSTFSHLPKPERPKKSEIFAGLVDQMKSRIRSQIAEQLAHIQTSGNAAVQTARTAAAAYILENLEVHPVSAPQFRKVLMDDEDDKPFLSTEEATGIPTLGAALSRVADREREARRRSRREVLDRFFRATASEVNILQVQWKDEGRAAADAERLRGALEPILREKQRESDKRTGAFREFLEATVRTKIRELVLEARSEAEVDVKRYLISLRSAHWATLRAAVRRGGVFFNGQRAINLPDDIANRFQEPMAAVWGQKLLKNIRQRTGEHAGDLATLVEELCIWASENGGAQINKSLLQRQRERIDDKTSQLKQVGKEAVDELRASVKQRLTDAIRQPILDACERFVERGDHYGTGVKQRILDLFDELASQATNSAERPTIDVLSQNFNIVRKEIRDAFEEWGDPLQQTADIIVERHTDRIKRSDAQRRATVLSAIEDVVNSCPASLDVERVQGISA